MKLEQELTIYEVETLHKTLVNLLNQGDVVLDASAVEKVDMSVIQLFIALKKSCNKENKKFELQNASQTLQTTLENSACTFLMEAKS